MRVRIANGTFYITSMGIQHNHPDHAVDVEAARMYSQLKIEARNTDEDVNILYGRAMQKVSRFSIEYLLDYL